MCQKESANFVVFLSPTSHTHKGSLCARTPNGLSKKKKRFYSIAPSRSHTAAESIFQATRQFLSTTSPSWHLALTRAAAAAPSLSLFCVVRFCSLEPARTHADIYIRFIYSRHVTFSYDGGAVSLDFSLQISNVSLAASAVAAVAVDVVIPSPLHVIRFWCACVCV